MFQHRPKQRVIVDSDRRGDVGEGMSQGVWAEELPVAVLSLLYISLLAAQVMYGIRMASIMRGVTPNGSDIRVIRFTEASQKIEIDELLLIDRKLLRPDPLNVGIDACLVADPKA